MSIITNSDVKNIIQQCTEFREINGNPVTDVKLLPKAREIKEIVQKAFKQYPENMELKAKADDMWDAVLEIHMSGALDRSWSYAKMAVWAYAGFTIFGAAYKTYKTFDFITYIATGHDISGLAMSNAPDCLRFKRPEPKRAIYDLNKELPVKNAMVPVVVPPWVEAIITHPPETTHDKPYLHEKKVDRDQKKAYEKATGKKWKPMV